MRTCCEVFESGSDVEWSLEPLGLPGARKIWTTHPWRTDMMALMDHMMGYKRVVEVGSKGGRHNCAVAGAKEFELNEGSCGQAQWARAGGGVPVGRDVLRGESMHYASKSLTVCWGEIVAVCFNAGLMSVLETLEWQVWNEDSGIKW